MTRPADETRITIRLARPEDAAGILEIHRSAILASASGAYPAEILNAWAYPPSPENAAHMARIIATESERILVAEMDHRIVAFGSIGPDAAELRALYVDAAFGRRGIGARLLAALEDLARAHGLAALRMDASLNAVPFYERHGFEAMERGDHMLHGGVRMPCVRMRKILTA